MTRDQILGHLEYGLQHVDALRWLCGLLISGRAPSAFTIALKGEKTTRRIAFTHLQNPIAEAGILYCRKLSDFMGVKLKRGNQELYERGRPSDTDDLYMEDLELDPISLDRLYESPYGDAESIETSFVHTLRSANKGVAHFTLDGKGKAELIAPCARTVIWLAETNIYGALGIPVPDFAVWTQGRH